MLATLMEDIKREYRYGNMVSRLIIANALVFTVVLLFKLVARITAGFGNPLPDFFDETLQLFMVSTNWSFDLRHPWTMLTYMFLHEGLWHILWNMLYLYWFGSIFRDLVGNHRVFPLYILGGVMGAVFFFVLGNIAYGWGHLSFALGASASVLAIAVAAGVLAPDYTVHLLFFGPVKLKYIILLAVLLDFVGIANDSNTGGHFAHFGGIFMGYLFAVQLRNGRDFSTYFQKIADSAKGLWQQFSRKEKPIEKAFKRRHEQQPQRPAQASDTPENKVDLQQKIDRILDKIKQSGYDSLTTEEKQVLFNASKKKD
jgi:membrane associated rhomboid family serine protease